MTCPAIQTTWVLLRLAGNARAGALGPLRNAGQGQTRVEGQVLATAVIHAARLVTFTIGAELSLDAEKTLILGAVFRRAILAGAVIQAAAPFAEIAPLAFGEERPIDGVAVLFVFHKLAADSRDTAVPRLR